MTITMAKDNRISIRVSSKVKTLLTTAASARNLSVSEFILDSAVQEANEAILDRRTFVLSAEDFDELMILMSDTAENQRRYEELRQKAAKWEW